MTSPYDHTFEGATADPGTTWQTAQEAFKPLLGDRRIDLDWQAFAREHPTPKGRDDATWLIECASKDWPPAGDMRGRLYHRGAPRTLALALGYRPPARER